MLRPVAGPQRPGAVEAGRDLVVDDERPVLSGQVVEDVEHPRGVDVHPPGSLEDGLEDDRGDVGGILREQVPRGAFPGDQLGVVVGEVEAGRGARGEDVLGQHAAEEGVHPADRVGDGHRREGVAVVAAADGQEAGAALTGREVELQSGLHRDLDRDRPGVGEEDVLHPGGREVEEAAAEVDGGCVREAAEHHVGHRVELAADGCVELGHAVPVDRAPPRAHRVDDLVGGAVGVAQPQPDALGGLDEVGVAGRQRRGVRVPHVRAVEGAQGGARADRHPSRPIMPVAVEASPPRPRPSNAV